MGWTTGAWAIGAWAGTAWAEQGAPQVQDEPSRSHKQEKARASIDWSIPFSVQKEELKTITKQITVVKAEISESKKEIDYTSSIYEINAISNRIDELLEKLELLLQQQARLQEIVSRKITPRVTDDTIWRKQVEAERLRAEEIVRQALIKREKQEQKVAKILEIIDAFDEDEYEKVVTYRLIKKKRKNAYH